MDRIKTLQAFQEAQQYIPGGVNSPVRALKAVGETPLFIEKAQGVTLTDIDGNQFTDFCLSWGVFLLGHSHSQVNAAVHQSIENGTSYGIPTLLETDLAKRVTKAFPSISKVRFVNSGTEAVMSAIRLARGYTQRDIIVKFDGCYHGHADHLLVSAGSAVANITNASSAGVPKGFTQYTVSLPYNDKEAVRTYFQQHGSEVAAVILEPVACNMGVVLPEEGFLSFLREITIQYEALLIFDEVITGLRLSLGGAQSLFNVTPDLTTIGKIVGGGFPAAAFGGKAEIMDLLAPNGPVYQAGTLSGNPVAMTAGIETLKILSSEGFYDRLTAKSEHFFHELERIVKGKDVQLNHIGSMFTLFFNKEKVTDFEQAKASNSALFGAYFRSMLSKQIYISPSQFEGNFISEAHSEETLNRTLAAISDSLRLL